MAMLTVPDAMLFCRNPGSAFGFSPNATSPKTSLAPVASAQFVCANCTFFFAEKSVTFPFRNVHESPSMSRPREGIGTSATKVPLALSSTGATPTSPVGRSTDRLAGDRANRDGDVLRHLLERLVGVCLLSLEHRRELLARDRRHGSGIARAKEPDVRVHVVEQADAVTRHAMETLDGVVLEIAVEQVVRLEPERRIGPCFLAFQRGRLCEFDRM